MKLSMAKFLQDTVEEMAVSADNMKNKEETMAFYDFIEKVKLLVRLLDAEGRRREERIFKQAGIERKVRRLKILFSHFCFTDTIEGRAANQQGHH